MKKIFSVIIACLLLLSLCGCGEGESNSFSRKNSDSPDATSSISQENSESKSTTLTEIKLSGPITGKNISLSGAMYTPGDGDLYIPFSYNKKYGIVNQNGKPVIENCESSLYNFFEDKGYMYDSGNDIFIDKNGNKTLETKAFSAVSGSLNGELVASLTQAKSTGSMSYDYFACVLDKNNQFSKTILSVPNGKIGNNSYIGLALPSFAYNENGFQGVGLHGILDGELNDAGTVKRRFFLFDVNGNLVAKYDAEKVLSTATSAYGVVNFGVYNSSTYVSGYQEIDFKKVIFPKNGYVNIMNDNGLWGLMNIKTGKTVIECKYDYVGAYSDGVATVCKYGTWGTIDLKGNVGIECNEYKYIANFVNNRAIAVDTNNNVFIIDKKGTKLGQFNGTVSGSTFSGTKVAFFCTEFISTTNLALIYKYENAYLINDKGEILASGDDHNNFVYMNDKYVVFKTGGTEEHKIFKINK